MSDSVSLQLSTMRALLDAVFPQLRAVYISAGNELWQVKFYVDREISDDDRESLEIAASEIAADLPDGFAWKEAIERLDSPQPIKPDTGWKPVFFRKERSTSDVEL